MTLAADRLRATWLVGVVNLPEPVAQMVTVHGVSRRDLDNAMNHVPTPDHATVRALLQG